MFLSGAPGRKGPEDPKLTLDSVNFDDSCTLFTILHPWIVSNPSDSANLTQIGPIPPSDSANVAQIGPIPPSDSANVGQFGPIPPSDSGNLIQICLTSPSDSANVAPIGPIPPSDSANTRSDSGNSAEIVPT